MKATSKSSTRRLSSEYVVSKPEKPRGITVMDILAKYPKVHILDNLDAFTALVHMSDDVHEQLSEEHPELTIDANILYEMHR
jgi:hypothetical protein